MKHIINILNLALAFATIIYVNHYVNVGDICRTIFGCTALMVWAWTFGREN